MLRSAIYSTCTASAILPTAHVQDLPDVNHGQFCPVQGAEPIRWEVCLWSCKQGQPSCHCTTRGPALIRGVCLLTADPQVLQPPHGVVYVAAKSFYFGVGGSTTSFMELVKADGILECTQVITA